MSIDDFSTKELRAELLRREVAEREEMRQQLAAEFPCPQCGAAPRVIETNLVAEHRFAPRDAEGHPMLYAPYEMGTTEGADYEVSIICENGHETRRVETRWFGRVCAP